MVSLLLEKVVRRKIMLFTKSSISLVFYGEAVVGHRIILLHMRQCLGE